MADESSNDLTHRDLLNPEPIVSREPTEKKESVNGNGDDIDRSNDPDGPSFDNASADGRNGQMIGKVLSDSAIKHIAKIVTEKLTLNEKIRSTMSEMKTEILAACTSNIETDTTDTKDKVEKLNEILCKIEQSLKEMNKKIDVEMITKAHLEQHRLNMTKWVGKEFEREFNSFWSANGLFRTLITNDIEQLKDDAEKHHKNTSNFLNVDLSDGQEEIKKLINLLNRQNRNLLNHVQANCVTVRDDIKKMESSLVRRIDSNGMIPILVIIIAILMIGWWNESFSWQNPF